MLTKGLAYISNQKQGTMDEGLKIVRKFIEEQIGIKKSEYVLENVSGFTRKNQFSARQLVNMLLWARNHFRIGTEYFQSLPVSGVDGTLEKRMKSVTGQVRAKTGLLNGVVGLAGFAETLSEHEVYIFAFIYNGGKDETLIKSKFDELAESIVK